MQYINLLLVLPVLFLLAICIGCDNESNSNAVAQPDLMLGTEVTGKVNITSAMCSGMTEDTFRLRKLRSAL